jgi:plasmid stabilization system protein ParE
MTPRLLLEPAAEEEYREAVGWYAERSPAVAEAFRASVRLALEAVEDSPARFPIALQDIRKARVPQFPYMVYFVVLPQVTTVIAIIHGRRDPERWQTRR